MTIHVPPNQGLFLLYANFRQFSRSDETRARLQRGDGPTVTDGKTTNVSA